MSAPSQDYGEIFDRGYLHYTGPRLGQAAAIWALARYSMARAIGIRRPWTAKVIPMLLYAAVAIPVIVSIGLRIFLPNIETMGYASFFGAIVLLEGIFVALIAPEMVSSDRQDKLLPLYFSRPIGRNAYVVGKMLATGILTLSMSLAPAVILWLGTGLLASDPVSGMRDSLDDLGRILLAGTLIAFYLGSIGLMISSFTGRKSVAVGIIVLGFVLTESLSFAIGEALVKQPELMQWTVLLSPARTIGSLVAGLFEIQDPDFFLPLNTAIAGMVGVILICGLIMFARYRRGD